MSEYELSKWSKPYAEEELADVERDVNEKFEEFRELKPNEVFVVTIELKEVPE